MGFTKIIIAHVMITLQNVKIEVEVNLIDREGKDDEKGKGKVNLSWL